MAWRIDESVIRGEIDNRTRDRVTGRIWFVGRPDAVELDLAGNAWRDLAGRRLEFVNPAPKPGRLDGFGARQTGVIGDCTASRKVKVPEIPLDQIGEYYAAGKKWPWHWGNSLYLEWFGTGNGRVVIESASYQLTIDPEAAWEMTPDEETAQRRANAEAMGGFFQQLGNAVASDPAGHGSPPDETGDEWREDAEAENANASLGEEKEEPDSPPDGFEPPKHPLVERAFELQLRLRQEAEQRGWMPSGASDEHPVADMVLSVRDGMRKLAGALHQHRWPPIEPLLDDTIERLQRARGYFGHALLAAAYCEQEKLVDAGWLANLQREVNALCHQCDLRIGELRPHQRPNAE